MVGEYKIEARIGEGGMATVYSAVHPLIGKKAAVKVMSRPLSNDQDAIKRFRQEALAVNQIGHLHIVDIFAFGSLPDGRSYFVMELLTGESLGQRMERQRLSLAEAIEILEQICDALEAAHEHNIVHRDLKPDNVFLVKQRSHRPMVKLLDFGIAKLAALGEGGGPLSTTRTGMIMGTPGYLSPEQARGKGVDQRTDIYALGCMAYEMILGRLPFHFDNAADAIRAHLVDAPPLPTSIWPDVPPALDSLLLEMLEKDAARRPTLQAVRDVLNQVRDSAIGAADWGSEGSAVSKLPSGAPIRPVPTPLSTPSEAAAGALPEPDPPVPGRRRGVLVVGILGAVVAVVAMVGIVGLKMRSPQPTAGAPPASADPAPPSGAAPSVPAPSVPASPAEPKPAPPATPVAEPPGEPKGTLVVKVNVANARIDLDGAPVVESADGARVPVKAGEHALVVSAPGQKPVHKTVKVSVGAEVEVNIKLRGGGGPSSPHKNPQQGGAPDNGYMLDPFGNKR
jgi:serine/threonine-protein kinase